MIYPVAKSSLLQISLVPHIDTCFYFLFSWCSIFLEERLEHLISGISCASLEPPSIGESLNDSTLKQRDSGGETNEQSGEAEESLDNGTCDETRKLERVGMCFPESNNHVTEADDSSPVIRESCLPNTGPLLRCPYLDEVSDSSSRYIHGQYIFLHLLSRIEKQSLY